MKRVSSIQNLVCTVDGIPILRTSWSILITLSNVVRRCLIPIMWTILTISLMKLPQTQEFFDGLLKVCGEDERRCGGTHGMHASALQFFVFEFSTFLLALSIWYSARVLASYQTPKAHNQNCFEKWIPRLLGAIPLYALASTLLGPISSIISPLQVALALGFVTLFLISPFFVHIHNPIKFSRSKMFIAVGIGIFGIIANTIRPSHDGAIWWSIGGWMIMFSFYSTFAWQISSGKFSRFFAIAIIELLSGWAIVEIGTLAQVTTNSGTWTWTVPVVMIVPALYVLFVLSRREMRWGRAGLYCIALLNRAINLRRFYRTLNPRIPIHAMSILLLSFILTLIFAFLLASQPDFFSKLLFSPAAIILWLLVLLLSTLTFFFAIPLAIRFTIITMWLTLIFFRDIPPLPLKQIEAPMPISSCQDKVGLCRPGESIGQRYAIWSKYHSNEQDSSPIIVVAASGGGARAAAHTATMLAAVDGATCGKFGDQVFAISAVSGGSLGAAAYVAARRDQPMSQAERINCLSSKQRWNYTNPRIEELARMTSQDHLSPTLIRLLFRDLVIGAVPAWMRSAAFDNSDLASRAGTLRTSWEKSYCQLLIRTRQFDTEKSKLHCTEKNTFAHAGDQPNSVNDPGPFMLFNATSVQDGRRVVMSQPLFCPDDGYCATNNNEDILSNAIDSARFPGISPAHNRHVFGWNKWTKEHVMTQRSIVDGGYFDNSGVVTLLEVIDGIIKTGVDPKRVIAVVINSDPQEGEPVVRVENAADSGLLAMIQTPIQTVIRVREGRTELALKTLEDIVSKSYVVYWPLTRSSLNEIDENVKAARARTPEQIAHELLHGSEDPKEKKFRREPPLGWALSQESSEKIMEYALSRVITYQDPDHTILIRERELIRWLYTDSVNTIALKNKVSK